MNSTTKPLKRIVIVGGGSAGWLVAGVIAAQHASGEGGVEITVIESPEVASIGVGEGTWPTMRGTLQRIGISETEFVRCCEASFKQGSKFTGWVDGAEEDSYYHPFSLPVGYESGIDVISHWQTQRHKVSFANAVSPQSYLCERHLAPKLLNQADFSGVANYGYHLNATKFAELMRKHCTGKLGVRQLCAHVTAVNGDSQGDIASVTTREHGDIYGDLFVDCTGMASLLLGQHFSVSLKEQRHILFNDSALVVQMPHQDSQGSIASYTESTATEAGWIWDIALPSRRGIGYVYASQYSSDEDAKACLAAYLEKHFGNRAMTREFRPIRFTPGYRERFWHRNCVAVGMAAGFIEPLEASALVMVELAAAKISDELPANRQVMDAHASRFNRLFTYRWERIIDFLKLHYVLSQRDDSDYWRDNRAAQSIPASLQELMLLWQHQVPMHGDLPHLDEVFSAASYQYILYGMGFSTDNRHIPLDKQQQARAYQLFNQVNHRANQWVAQVPDNRELIKEIIESRAPAA